MAWFVAMCVLPDHTGTEDRQVFCRFRNVGEHTVQFLSETFLASDQADQTVQILRYRPEILPAITFTDIFGIVVGAEVCSEVPFLVTRLHERSGRIINIPVVLSTFVEFIGDLFLAHLLCHCCNTIIIISIFQCLG